MRRIPPIDWNGTVGIMLMLVMLPCILKSQDSTRFFDSKNRQVLYTASLSSAVLFTGAFLADQPLREGVQLNHSSMGDAVSQYTNYLGDKRLVLSLNGALLATGYLVDDPGLFRTSWNAAKSVFSTAVLTEGLKHTFGRSRPYTENGPRHFNSFPPNRHAFKSLPSRHPSLPFAFFTPFAEKYSRWLYILPVSAGAARIYKDKHWASDVVLGAAIGFFTGYFFQHKNQHLEVSFNRIVVRF